jgi:DNA polymerase-3 subunit epsilon
VRRVLIIDTETNGLDPEANQVVEVGCILWNLEHQTYEECYSALLPAPHNEAAAINGIKVAMLPKEAVAWEVVDELAALSDAFVAHNAPFDQSFSEPHLKTKKTWICTMEDFVWPAPLGKKALTDIALAHGVAVVSAHRALTDCMTIARLFERVSDSSDRLRQAFQRAQRPKAFVVAMVSYPQRDLAKTAGFRWDGERKAWWKVMAIEDAKRLPFDVKMKPL